MKSKEPVKLRQRVMPSGRTSLYLDIRVNGKRNYEYLNLYLEKGNTTEIRTHNKQTLMYAEAIRAQRLLEVRNSRFGLEPTDNPDASYFDLHEILMKERKGCYWKACLTRLKELCPDGLTLREVTPRWVKSFVAFLQKDGLTAPSISTYIATLNTTLNYAVKEGVIVRNPIKGVIPHKRSDSERAFLTIEELQQLAATPTKYDVVRRAFLFSCLTGLRFSDVSTITWGQVSKVGTMNRITFKQKKTQGLQYLDINEQAVELMGEAKMPSQKIFPLPVIAHTNKLLGRWVTSSGVDKYITFHSGRHTFAVMMLDLGADIYTVQKLLGHRNINTTQIYAKILDKNKQEAVQRIPKIMI